MLSELIFKKQQDIKKNFSYDSIVSSPKFTQINVNEECFFRCKMCFKWRPDIYKPKVSKQVKTSEIKKFLLSLSSITGRGYVVNFAGGEPLLRKDLLEIINYASILGFHAQLSTNGWLIDRRMAKKIVESGLKGINISIDGTTAETHDKMRGTPGSFDKAVNAIKYLNEINDITIAIQTVLCELNYHEAIGMINWVDGSKEIKALHFNVVTQPNNTHYNSNWYKEEFSYLWPKDIEKIHGVLDKIIGKKMSDSRIVQSVEQLKAYKEYFKNPKEFVKYTPCHFDRTLSLSSIGDMFMCFNHEKIGNVRNNNANTVWKSNRAVKIRENIKNCKKNCHVLLNCNYKG